MRLYEHPYFHFTRTAVARLAALRREDVRSVAVIKHAALGDLVLTRPFLVEVRRHFPNASITLGAIANYVHGLPEDLVDRIHVAAGQFRPRPSWRERLRSYRELGYHDLLFDLTASSASAWITKVNPAQVKFGFAHNPFSRWIYDVTLPRSILTYEAQTYLHMLALLRLRYAWPPDFGWPPHVAASDPPYLVYFPTASGPSRCWPAERFGALMGRLAQALPHHEHRLLYGMGAWEVEADDLALAAAGAHPNIKAVRDATGDAFRALLRGATLFIGNDTGVKHLATGLGTPTLALMPRSLVDTYLPRFDFHDEVHDPEGEEPTVDAVEQAALRLLERIRKAG
jgi:ADP-heptose:LPS heptosyltransferase